MELMIYLASKFSKMLKMGVFTSLCAPAIILSSAIILSKPVSIIFLVIIYFAALLIYVADYFSENKKGPFIFLFLGSVGIIPIVITLLTANAKSFFFLLLIIFLGIAYPYFFKKFTDRILGFKDIFVAICWNLIVPFYFIFNNYVFSLSLLFFLVFLFLRTLVDISFCDIKDIKEDKTKGLKTFAVYFGKEKMIVFLQILNFISILILFLGMLSKIFPNFTILLLLPVGLSIWQISKSKYNSNFSTILVDLEFFLWPLVLYLGTEVI